MNKWYLITVISIFLLLWWNLPLGLAMTIMFLGSGIIGFLMIILHLLKKGSEK